MMMPLAVLIEATVVSAPMDAGCAAGALLGVKAALVAALDCSAPQVVASALALCSGAFAASRSCLSESLDLVSSSTRS